MLYLKSSKGKELKEMRKREKFLVIDTETCNSIEQPLVYDIGYAICDRFGDIVVERSFVVAETFIGLKDTMESAYYAEKIPQYWEDIKQGKRVVKSIFNIRKQIKEDMRAYKINKVLAYNINFDKRALNNTIRYCSKSLVRWFFPFGVEFQCIWNMACQVILSQSAYVKFALQNGLENEKGNLSTSAESCYKYIKNHLDFVESHTGLEDVKIEVEIFAHCLRMKKKLDRKANPSCWRIPQRKRKELDLKKTFK